MKKFIKNNLFGFILGAVIFSSIGVVAYSLSAKDISFTPSDSNWQVDNINDAINDLYEFNDISNLEFIGSNVNKRSAWSTATNTLSTSYNLEKGKYLIVVTGETSTQDRTSIGEVTTKLNQTAILINTYQSENVVSSGTTAHGKVITSIYLLNLDNAETLTASYTSYYAMQQQILLQIFEIK